MPMLAMGIFLEVLLQRIPNDYAFKNSHLVHHANEIETLYLGNSHIFYGIDPSYLSGKTFNAALISQSQDYDLNILKLYENNWISLKQIVVPVDYFSLFFNLDTGIESWRRKNYTIYYGMPDWVTSNHFELSSEKLKHNIKRAYGYYRHGKSDLSCNALGWGNGYNSTKQKNLRQSAVEAMARHTAQDWGLLAQNSLILKQIVNWADQRGIQVVLISTPVHQSYRDLMDEQQWKTTLGTIARLQKQHPGLRYINLTESPDFTAMDYYDADHLNELGAQKLSLKCNALLARKSAKTR